MVACANAGSFWVNNAVTGLSCGVQDKIGFIVNSRLLNKTSCIGNLKCLAPERQ